MATPNNLSMGAPVRYLCGDPVCAAPLQVAGHAPIPIQPNSLDAIISARFNLPRLPMIHGEEPVHPNPLPDATTAAWFYLPRRPTALGEEQSSYLLADRDHALLGTPRMLVPQATNAGFLSTPDPLPASMGKGPKLPMPKAINEDFLQKNSNDMLMVKNRLELIADYIAPGVSLSMYTWKDGFRPFMLARLAMGFISTYFLEHTEFDRDDFIQAFISAVTGDVRPGDVVALDELHSGKVTQGADPVANYNERFFQRSRQLPVNHR